MCWLLWKRRCRLLLEEDVGVLDDVLVTGNCLLMQTKDAFTMLVGSNARNAVARTWCRPQPGWRGRELGVGSSAFYLPPEGTTALVIQEKGASGAVPGMHARGAPVISGAAVSDKGNAAFVFFPFHAYIIPNSLLIAFTNSSSSVFALICRQKQRNLSFLLWTPPALQP
ncbi:hypothetical protein V6N13_138646 [Hibiscus sabdariffa]